MNGDRLERDLAVWFTETAVPSVPDYTDEIVREATRTRQRPRWSFVGRWLPSAIAYVRLPGSSRNAWQAVVLVAVILGLLLAALAAIGSRTRLPPPFGPAGNGLLAFERGGDIFTFDPGTGRRQAIVTGPEQDHDPRWSRDGRRIAFARESTEGTRIAFVDVDGTGLILASTALTDVDTDSMAWAPDGSAIAVGADVVGDVRAIYVVNATDGLTRVVNDIRYSEFEIYWRPGTHRQFLVTEWFEPKPRLALYSFETGRVDPIAATYNDSELRPLGWTLDGQRFLYQGAKPGLPVQVIVTDVATGAETPLDVLFGHVSNDGRQVVGLARPLESASICVVPIEGGTCVRIGNSSQLPDETHNAALQWSPNDAVFTIYDADSGGVLLLPNGAASGDMLMLTDGPASWQRTAR